MTDEPVFEYQDADRDGIPDVLDIQIDPAPFDVMATESRLGDADVDGISEALDVQVTPAGEPSTEEALLELQAKKERESLMTSTLTNIENMKHESLKGIAKNLRG
jgi:hypothetical protein